MTLDDKISLALALNPALGVLISAGLIIALAALTGLGIFLIRRYQAGLFRAFTVRPLSFPAVDVLALLFVLVWTMLLPGGNWLFFCGVIGGVLWLGRHHRVDWRERWGAGRFSWGRWAGLVGWFYLSVLGLILPLSWLMDAMAKRWNWDLAPQQSVDLIFTTTNLWSLGWLLFVAVVLAPAAEEILFRGFLHPVLKNRMPGWAAWVVTAAIFATIHFHVMTFPQLFCLGLFLGAVYELTGSLSLCVGLHMCFNAATAIWLLTLRWWLT